MNAEKYDNKFKRGEGYRSTADEVTKECWDKVGPAAVKYVDVCSVHTANADGDKIAE